jgi:hypothetical protein
MKRKFVTSLVGVCAAPRAALLAFASAAQSAFKLVRSWVESGWRWHRRRMITDPTYPVALLAIGKAVVRIAVPSASRKSPVRRL